MAKDNYFLLNRFVLSNTGEEASSRCINLIPGCGSGSHDIQRIE